MQTAFKKGWNQVPQGKTKEVRSEIMHRLGINSTQAFYSRMRGVPELRVSQASQVAEVFAVYGITDIWGDE